MPNFQEQNAKVTSYIELQERDDFLKVSLNRPCHPFPFKTICYNVVTNFWPKIRQPSFVLSTVDVEGKERTNKNRVEPTQTSNILQLFAIYTLSLFLKKPNERLEGEGGRERD